MLGTPQPGQQQREQELSSTVSCHYRPIYTLIALRMGCACHPEAAVIIIIACSAFHKVAFTSPDAFTLHRNLSTTQELRPSTPLCKQLR